MITPKFPKTSKFESPSSAPTSPPAVANDYGLHDWKDYSLVKHSNTSRYQSTAHGREAVEISILKKYSSEILELRQWGDQVEDAAQDILLQLQVEKRAKRFAEQKVKRVLPTFCTYYNICFLCGNSCLLWKSI